MSIIAGSVSHPVLYCFLVSHTPVVLGSGRRGAPVTEHVRIKKPCSKKQGSAQMTAGQIRTLSAAAHHGHAFPSRLATKIFAFCFI